MAEEKFRWPGWETGRIIGRGSYGTVYEIHRQIGGRSEQAALKVISIPSDESEIRELQIEGYDNESITKYYADSLGRIEQEYALMAGMRGHSNIVYCDDILTRGHENGFGWDIYIRMELLTPLKTFLGKEIPEEQVIQLGLDLCRALTICRQYNVVHRDIKPENIFVSRDGTYKLGDFGIAKTMESTTGGTKTGTYDYMAPEVYNGKPYGSGADLYSLGLVLYWLLNDRRGPFLTEGRPTPSQKAAARDRRLSGEVLPPPARGSRELQEIVLRACAYETEDRYPDAGAMYEALSALGGAVRAAAADPDGEAAGPEKEEPEWEATLGVSFYEKQSEDASGESREGTIGPNFTRERKKKRSPRLLRLLLAVAVSLALAAAGFFTIHIWEKADCEDERKCVLCGKEKAASGHSWSGGSCTEDAVCSVCGVVSAASGHEWSGGSCTEKAVCALCGENSDIPGHSWEGGSCTVDAVCSACGAVSAAPGHSWEGGSCTENAVCAACGEVSSAPGHEWNGGSCTEAAVCATCGETGVVETHAWEETSEAFAARLCSKCGAFGTDAAVSTYGGHTLWLHEDGMVSAAGQNSEGQCDVSDWSNIVAVSAGYRHSVGLRADGTVVATGLNSGGQCEVSGWTDIVDICTGWECTVGVRRDGTVLYTGTAYDGAHRVSGWSDIVQVGANDILTVGLRRDGTVVATGYLEQEFPESAAKMAGWRDVVSVCVGDLCVVGLRADGTVVAVKALEVDGYQGTAEDVTEWRDIVSVDACGEIIFALGKDGRVKVAVGEYIGQADCKNIKAIGAGVGYGIFIGENDEIYTFGEPEERLFDFK